MWTWLVDQNRTYTLKWVSGLGLELDEGKKLIDAAFQKSSPTSPAEKGGFDVKTMTKAYHKYKREYVKQLIFTPEEEAM